MKKIFTRNILLLCFLFAVERFAFYSARSILALYLIRFLKLPESDAYNIYGLISFLAPVGFILTAIFIDRFKIFRDFKLFFIIIGIGSCLLFFKGESFLFTGMILIIVAGSFIKINILVQLFENLSPAVSKTDNAFILLYLLFMIFVGLSPLFSNSLTTSMGYKFGLPLTVLIPWVIFAPIFLIFYKPGNIDTQGHHLSLSNNTRVIITLAGIILLMGFFSYFEIFGTDFMKNSSLHMALNQQLVLSVFYIIAGLILLFILKPLLQFRKIGIAIILLYVIGMMYVFSEATGRNYSFINYTVNSLKGVVEIISYPAIISLVLIMAKPDRRGTAVSLLMIGIAILFDMLNRMTFMRGGILLTSSVIAVILLVVLHILNLRNKFPETAEPENEIQQVRK